MSDDTLMDAAVPGALVGAIGTAIKYARSLQAATKRRLRPEEPIAVLIGRVSVEARRTEMPSITCVLNIVNRTGYHWTVDHAEIKYWTLANRALPKQAQHLSADGDLGRWSAAEVWLNIPLDPLLVGQLLQAIRPASNQFSSPRAEFYIDGAVVLRRKSRVHRARFAGRTSNVELELPDRL